MAEHGPRVPRTGARVVIRLALVALLLVALWGPALPGGPGPVDVIVVLDESPSARAAGLPALLGALVPELTRLPAGSRTALVRFAAEAVVAAAPASAGASLAATGATLPDGDATDVQAGIEAALALAHERKATTLLLLTDGVATRGDTASALRAARAAGVSVLLHAGAFERGGADAWVSTLALPARARAGEPFVVEATVASAVARDLRLEIRVDGARALESVLPLAAGGSKVVRSTLALARPGVYEIAAAVVAPRDPRPLDDRRRGLLVVEAAPAALVVTDAEPALADSLERGGWSVRRVLPERFPRTEREAAGFDLMVLDDVAIPEMHADAWSTLVSAVRARGAGLIVGGGPRSFGAGAYRGSALEAILPVTAEAAGGDGMAVQFLIDKSGSMDRDLRASDRLAHARRAVLATVRGFGPHDRLGLAGFDVEHKPLLPLARYDDPVQAVDEAWHLSPGGGTRLAPALGAAIEPLATAPGSQRALVVVSDGFVGDGAPLAAMGQPLDAAGIRLIVLIIGQQRTTPALERLAVASGGALLRVGEVAELPRFMRGALDNLRQPLRLEPTTPIEVEALPFAPTMGEFPGLSGYAVSRARANASTYLAAANGDPLLAAHRVGLARVAVLPGGLGEWARRWPRWREWGLFAGGLAGWVRTPSRRHDATLGVQDRELVIEAVSERGEWLSAGAGRGTLARDGRLLGEFPIEAVAPGRYRGTLPFDGPGRYSLGWRIGALAGRRELLHDPVPDEHAVPALRHAGAGPTQWLEDGLARRWLPGESLVSPGGPQLRRPLRPWLLGAVLAGYLVVLGMERRP